MTPADDQAAVVALDAPFKPLPQKPPSVTVDAQTPTGEIRIKEPLASLLRFAVALAATALLVRARPAAPRPWRVVLPMSKGDDCTQFP